ncbi:MAG: FecR family protein [Planctomycetota bacterium]|jgi:hypothetical protein
MKNHEFVGCVVRRALLVLGACSLILTTAAISAEASKAAVGKIEEMNGRATAHDTQQVKRKLTGGAEVYMGDTLRTGRGSKLKIRFNDATTIIIGQKAKLVINEFVYKAGDKNSKLTTTLDRGMFRVIGGAIGKLAPDQTKVKTPTATIGIRGTECVGLASAKSLTAIFTEGHAISVTNPKGQTILTGEINMGCETLLGEKPGKARVYSIGEINRITRGIVMRSVRSATRAATQAGVRGGSIPSSQQHGGKGAPKVHCP